jgi:carboxyl-terminal processing protease
VGERYLDYAMPWDTIPKLNYKLWFKKPLDLKGLQAKSSERVNQSPAFKAILKHIDYVNQQKKTSLAPLLVTEAIKEKIQSKKESDAYDKSIQDFADIDYISPDIAGLTVAQKESYKDWIKELKKDPYLYEAFAILNDLNNELAVKQP